jgi:hypothetical protein
MGFVGGLHFSGLPSFLLEWLKQFLKRPFLPAARFFGLLHRNFYKADARRGAALHFFRGKDAFALGLCAGWEIAFRLPNLHKNNVAYSSCQECKP